MIHEELRRIRKEHHLTQSDVSEVLGIDRTTYTFYEIGKTSPSIKIVQRLADMYNCTIGYLCGCEENTPELKNRHVRLNAGAPEVDPVAFLAKDEQLMLMYYRISDNEKRQEILKQLKAYASETAE